MEEFVLLRHCDLSNKVVNDIISIKQQHWNYPYETQNEWLHNNIKKDDKHLLLYVDGHITAYLNLVNVSIGIEDKNIIAIGIGNVCVAKCIIGNGYGRKIVQRANEIIKEEKNKAGILLCKDSLEGFYTLLGWHKLSCNNVFVAGKDYDKTIMLFNSAIVKTEKLTIDRNF